MAATTAPAVGQRASPTATSSAPILLTALLAFSFPLPLRAELPVSERVSGRAADIPRRFWMFAGFAVLYGICETVNGN